MNEKELAKFVGSRIREYRKKKGLTQKELGERIGVKHNTVSNYETGAISAEQDALFAITRELDITLDDLFPSKKDGSLDKAVQLSDEKMDLADMAFYKDLEKQIESFQGEERKELMRQIQFAVELFKNSKN